MKVTVAGIQMSATVGNDGVNLEKALHYVEEAADGGADIICLPELFHCGYFCASGMNDTRFFDSAQTDAGPVVRALTNAMRGRSTTLVAPIFEHAGSSTYYNSIFLITELGVVARYRKIHLPWSITGWEKRYFRPGSAVEVHSVSGVNVGLMMCYDRVFPELGRMLGLLGAQLICVPSGAPAYLPNSWAAVLQTRALENQCFLLGVNLVGRSLPDGHEMGGNSMFIDPLGNVKAQLSGVDEGILCGEVDLAELQEIRRVHMHYRDIQLPTSIGELLNASPVNSVGASEGRQRD